MIRIITALLRPFYGKTILQYLYRGIHYVGLKGMNFGNADIKSNGELAFLKRMKKSLGATEQKNIIVFDVGANTGEYSILVNKVFGDLNLSLYAFEPSKRTHALLSKTVAGHSAITTVNAACSDASGNAVLYASSDGDTLASLYHRDVLDEISKNNTTEEQISLITLDEFCKHKQIDKIDFLKIDVEGNELKVLKGAKKMLSEGKIDTIQLEFGGTAIDAKTYIKDFYDLLKEYDYEFGRLLKDGIEVYSKYHIHREIFDFANYVAWKK